MITYILIVLFSFFLDGIMSNCFFSSFFYISFFNTIYTIISLVIIINFFTNYKKYIALTAVIGILFDIVFTNTLALNIFLFPLLGLWIIWLNSKLSNNIVNNVIISQTTIFLYYTVVFFLLKLINYFDYNILLLFKLLINSIMATTFYSIVLTIILKKIDNKFNLKIVK